MAVADDAAALDNPARSELAAPGLLTTFAAVVGLTLGPSVIAVLAFGVYVGSFEAEFGWTRVQVMLVSTIVAYVIMAVSPLQGILVDRYGPRRVILTSIPAFAAGVGLLYFTPSSLPAFYLLWAALPVLGLGLWPLAYLRAVSGWFDRHLGFALGVANAGIGVGSAIVPLIMSLLIDAFGWRLAFVYLAGLVLFVTWPLVFFGLREPGAKRDNASALPAMYGYEFRSSAATSEFRWLVVVFFLFGLVTTAIVTQQVPMLIDAGRTAQQAAVVQSVFGVGLMVGRVGVGFVLDRIFAPFVMLAVALGGAIGCAIYGAASTGLLAFASAALVGLLVGAEFDVLAFLIKRYFGTRAFGKLYGTIFAVFQLGAGVGVLGFSLLRQEFGGYAVGLYTFAVILAASAFVLARLGEYRFVPPEARPA